MLVKFRFLYRLRVRGRACRGTAVIAEPQQMETVTPGSYGVGRMMDNHIRMEGLCCRCTKLCLNVKQIFLRWTRSCQLRPTPVAMMTYRKVSVSWRWSSDMCCMGSGRHRKFVSADRMSHC